MTDAEFNELVETYGYPRAVAIRLEEEGSAGADD